MRLYAMERFLDRARIPMKLDFSTDDAITPGAVELSYPRLLEDGEIPIMAYNLETLLAEKLETVISRGVTNTRMRDFYDIFALLEVKGESIETPILRAAIEATFGKRETDPSPENARLAKGRPYNRCDDGSCRRVCGDVVRARSAIQLGPFPITVSSEPSWMLSPAAPSERRSLVEACRQRPGTPVQES